MSTLFFGHGMNYIFKRFPFAPLEVKCICKDLCKEIAQIVYNQNSLTHRLYRLSCIQGPRAKSRVHSG